jgi:transcriptional regulator with XRE-family HTH domain
MDGLGELGALVRRHRSDVGLSGAELARRAGVSQPSVWRVESGRRLSDVAVVEQIALALTLDPSVERELVELARDAYGASARPRVDSGVSTTDRLGEAQQEVAELARLRRRRIQDLHAQGMSYAQIGEAAGLTRGRIHQIRHTGPAPEGAFLGTGIVILATPLNREERGGRPVVAVEDVTASTRLEALARSFALEVTTERVPLGGKIDLNREGLIVICDPRLSEIMGQAYAADPVIRWEQIESGAWALRDSSPASCTSPPWMTGPAGMKTLPTSAGCRVPMVRAHSWHSPAFTHPAPSAWSHC